MLTLGVHLRLLLMSFFFACIDGCLVHFSLLAVLTELLLVAMMSGVAFALHSLYHSGRVGVLVSSGPMTVRRPRRETV